MLKTKLAEQRKEAAEARPKANAEKPKKAA
jgi:hypothetical protein